MSQTKEKKKKEPPGTYHKEQVKKSPLEVIKGILEKLEDEIHRLTNGGIHPGSGGMP